MKVANTRKLIPLAILTIICLTAIIIYLTGCEKDSGGSSWGSLAKDQWSSGCTESAPLESADDTADAPVPETMKVTWALGKMAVEHMNFGRACSYGSEVTSEVSGDTIKVIEGEKGACDGVTGCSCCFDIGYTVPDVKQKSYHLVIAKEWCDGSDYQTEKTFETDVNFAEQEDYLIEIREIGCWADQHPPAG